MGGRGKGICCRFVAQCFQKKFIDSIAKFLSQVLDAFYIGLRDICICEQNSKL